MATIIKIYTETTEDKNSKLKQKEEKKDELEFKKLKLKNEKKVHWTEDTVNNEGMGKKKSKICCIYHKPRLNPDDTSSDESCDSCDEKGKNAYERPNHYEKHKHNHDHKHNNKDKKIK